MQLFWDYLPILCFFVAYKMFNIFVATAVAMIVLLGQVGFTYYKKRHVSTIQLVNLGLLLVFGGATLLLHKMIYIQWKVTVVYWVFALSLWIAQTFFKKNVLKNLMGEQIELPAHVWNQLTLAWSVFFGAMGAINLYVIYNYTTDQWVNFKLFGTFALLILFCLGQGIFLSRYIKKGDKAIQKTHRGPDDAS